MDDVTMAATAATYAAAAVCSTIYGMVAVGRGDAASYVFGELSSELRRDVLRIMEADLPARVAEAINGGVPHPDEMLVDETTQPARITVREMTDAEKQPQEPLWMQYVESALLVVLQGDRDLVAKITSDANAYRSLVRHVRRRADEDETKTVEVLQQLGAAKLKAVTRFANPVVYLISELRD